MASHLVRCPRCGEPNPDSASACASCGATLAWPCLHCGTIRSWHQFVCPQCGADIAGMPYPSADWPQGPETGRTIADRYVLLERIASSRTGAIYAAHDATDASRRYVIKQLSTIALFRADERREATRRLHAAVDRWRQVEHEAAVSIHDLLLGERDHYVVMDAVPGLSFGQIIVSAHLAVSPDLARNWGRQICTLLDHLHSLPQPVYAPFLSAGHAMVTPDGTVRLVDLGLSHLFAGTDPTYGPYGTIKGYGAPELDTAPYAPASDIFAVGRLLYALLAGVLLEEGARGAPSLQRAVPGISRQLVRTIARAAHRDADERFATAQDLDSALADGETQAPTPVSDWLTRARQSAAARAPRAASSSKRAARPRQRQGPSMADFGYRRDDRFGPSHADVAAGEEPAPLPETATAPPRRVPEPTTTPKGTPRLSVQPQEIHLEDLRPTDTKRVALRVRNTGDAPLEARVISRTVGVSAPNQAFRLAPGKQARVLLTINATELPSEDVAIQRAVEVESNAGKASIGLRAAIRTAPLLHVATPELDFGQQTPDDQIQQILVIENRGRRLMTGRVVANVPWLAVQREAFQCMGSQQVRLPVSLRSERLSPGLTAQDDALLIDSDGGQARIAAQVFLAEPQLQLDADALAFGDIHPDDTLTAVLILHNTGDADLRGSARSYADWLRVNPDRFICPAGDTVHLELVLSTANMAPGPLNLDRALQIRSNGGDAVLPLHARLRAPRLVLIDETIDFGDIRPHERAHSDVRLRNDGNALLIARADALVPWLGFADGARTAQLEVEPGATASLSLVADLEALATEGETEVEAAVRLVSEARLVELPARLRVLKPALSVEPDALDFRYIERSDTETLALEIGNAGSGQLGWSAAVDAEWVELAPSSGILAPGDKETLTLTAYGLALGSEEQTAEATLAITSDAGRAKIPLRVGIAAPLLATDTTRLSLGPSVNRRPVEGTLRIFNHGLGSLKGVIASDRTWLVSERTAFDCPTGRSLPVTLRTDMDEFPHDATEDEATLTITSNGGNTTVHVSLQVRFEAELASASETIRLTPSSDAYQGRLVLRNQGMAHTRAELRGSLPQLEFSRDLCDVKPGKSVRIVVEWRGTEPQPEEPLYVEVESAEQALRIPVELAD